MSLLKVKRLFVSLINCYSSVLNCCFLVLVTFSRADRSSARSYQLRARDRLGAAPLLIKGITKSSYWIDSYALICSVVLRR